MSKDYVVEAYVPEAVLIQEAYRHEDWETVLKVLIGPKDWNSQSAVDDYLAHIARLIEDWIARIKRFSLGINRVYARLGSNTALTEDLEAVSEAVSFAGMEIRRQEELYYTTFVRVRDAARGIGLTAPEQPQEFGRVS